MKKSGLPASLVFFWGLAGMIVLAGCGLTQLAREDLKPPRVTLRSFNLKAPNPQGWPVACTFKLENPNPRAFDLSGYDYEIWLEGQSAVKGESSEAVSLPANGQALVTVPAVVNLSALPRVLPRLFRQEKLRYEIAGGFRPAALGGLARMPFRFQGQLALPEGVKPLKSYLPWLSPHQTPESQSLIKAR